MIAITNQMGMGQFGQKQRKAHREQDSLFLGLAACESMD